ncbi:MAG: redoxin family protein [Myxococcaceae bacterium]
MNVARVLLVAFTLVGSATPVWAAEESVLPDLTLAATNGQSYSLRKAVSDARYTVFVFFSAHCQCLTAHDDRLTQLARGYEPKDVQFFLVDSEVGDALERDRTEAQRRQYPFPILADPGGRLAQAFGVRFATTTLVVDSAGNVRYHGGIDSEKRQPNPAGRFYLKEALSALLAGKAPDFTETKSLGCYLRFS